MVRFALMLATLAVLAVAVLTAGPPTAELRAAIAAATRLQQGGDLEGAAAAFARVREDAGAGTHERAEALLGLAAIETDLGRYAAAEADANAAADIFTLLGDASAASAAANQSGLAALFEGRYPAADAAFRRALAAAGPSGDPDARAEQLGNLGNVHFFTGQYADAARLYEDALRIVESNRDRAWAARRRRILLANQATLEQRLGRDETALTLYRELDGSSADLAPSEQAQLLVNLGVLYRRLGDPIKALDMYDRARRLFVQDRHADGELGVLKNRGIVLAIDLGRLDEAERTFTEALTTATRLGNQREMAHALIYRGETRRRAGAMTDAHADFAAALRLARTLTMPEEVWKALYGLGRTDVDPGVAAAHLDEAIDTIERIREAIRIPSRRSDFLNDKREVFDARLAASLAGGADVGAIFALLERSHSRGWRERLGLSATVSLQAVQAALPDDGLLLDYWHADNGAAVIAVSRHRAEVLSIRAPAAAVAGYADRWALSPRARDARGATALDLLPPASWFTGVRHVIVVPDGPLALVPFEVLAAADRPLIERAAVSYLPTAAALLRASPALPWRLPPWHTMLRAFGDPVVGASTLDDAGRVRGRIAATGREVRTIASRLAGRSDLLPWRSRSQGGTAR